MAHWVSQAFTTYILHPEHGAGYQWWSGAAGGTLPFTMLAWLAVTWSRHNCHVRHCWRVGRRQYGDLLLCHKHHPRDPPKSSEID